MKGYVIETILAWAFLVCGIVFKNPTYFIASGLFAIAMQIGLSRDKRSERNDR